MMVSGGFVIEIFSKDKNKMVPFSKKPDFEWMAGGEMIATPDRSEPEKKPKTPEEQMKDHQGRVDTLLEGYNKMAASMGLPEMKREQLMAGKKEGQGGDMADGQLGQKAERQTGKMTLAQEREALQGMVKDVDRQLQPVLEKLKIGEKPREKGPDQAAGQKMPGDPLDRQAIMGRWNLMERITAYDNVQRIGEETGIDVSESLNRLRREIDQHNSQLIDQGVDLRGPVKEPEPINVDHQAKRGVRPDMRETSESLDALHASSLKHRTENGADVLTQSPRTESAAGLSADAAGKWMERMGNETEQKKETSAGNAGEQSFQDRLASARNRLESMQTTVESQEKAKAEELNKLDQPENRPVETEQKTVDQPEQKKEEDQQKVEENVDKKEAQEGQPLEGQQKESAKQEALGGLNQEVVSGAEKGADVSSQEERNTTGKGEASETEKAGGAEEQAPEGKAGEKQEDKVVKAEQVKERRMAREIKKMFGEGKWMEEMKGMTEAIRSGNIDDLPMSPKAKEVFSGGMEKLQTVMSKKGAKLEDIKAAVKDIGTGINNIGKKLKENPEAFGTINNDNLKKVVETFANMGEKFGVNMDKGKMTKNMEQVVLYFRGLSQLAKEKMKYFIEKKTKPGAAIEQSPASGQRQEEAA